MERKLAAIMAIDVVGFAGLSSRNEDDTLARVAKLKDNIIEMQVEANRGRLFKSLGDGFLAEFSSTLEAVNCAVGIQRSAILDAKTASDDEALMLRIGVSLGDVVVQDGDLLGNGVNTAARLEALAEPAGIAVSADVMAQIKGKIDLPLEDVGHKRVKDTDVPLHVYMTKSRAGLNGGFMDLDDEALKGSMITGGCLCGSIRFEISAPPISTGYCHCSICQKFTGSSMSTWTAFPASTVQFLGAEPRYFATSPIAERGFCPKCGSSMTYRLIQPKKAAYLVLMTPTLDDPRKHAPAAHSGIESKMPWIEILDDLPRTRTAESRVLQEAWTSVGLPDPDTWGPLAKPPDVL
jgi:adenylate cyclase